MKELTENILSFKFQFILIGCLVLTLVSFFVMAADYRGRCSKHDLSGENSDIVSNFPNPLSIFVKGLDEDISASYEFDQTFNLVRKKSTPNQVNFIFSLFSTPDFLFLSKIIYTLIAILFSFDIISREKEEGTLQLLFSNPVSRSAVLLGKTFGGVATFSIPILFSFFTGAIFLILPGSMPFTLSDIFKMLILLLFSHLFLLIFFLLGVLLSIFTKRSSISLVILLFLWSVLIFSLPNLSPLLAEHFSGLPSEQYFRQMKIQQWVKSMFLLSERGRGESQRQLIYKEMRSDDSKLWNDYKIKLNRILQLNERLNKLSPVGCYTEIATALAGTGVKDYVWLKNQMLNHENFANNSSFKYDRLNLSKVFSLSVLISLLIQVSICLILLLLATLFFLKLDVRWK